MVSAKVSLVSPEEQKTVEHGHFKLQFGDGKYTGELVNGEPNGFGVAKYQSMTYTGEWKDCLRHGHGVEEFRNGVIFDGVFSHGRRNGYGTLYYPDGSKVSAIWNGNKVCEYGTMTNLNQNAHYEGAFDQEGNQQPPNFKIR